MSSARRPGRKATLRAVAASLEAAERWELRLYVAGDLSNNERTLVGMVLVAEP